MNNSSRIVLGLAASILAIAAQAGGVQARDVPRITNGGTGVIGGPDSNAYPYQAQQGGMVHAPGHAMPSSAMAPATRTMPEAQAQQTWPRAAVMGSGRAQASGDLAARHPAWGTPD